MQPNFPDGEYLLTDKITYRLRVPKRGEVVVFEAPGTNGDEFIKRIIGLPNERVKLEAGYVFINDQRLNEPYLPQGTITSGGSFLKEGQEVVVPDVNYFVLGDNRKASSDSRTWGYVGKEKINGRAWIIYWPPPKVGLVKGFTYNFY